MAKLLLGIKREVEGTWYAPEKWLREQRDVVRAELWDTTNSSGDWSGFFVQKCKGRYWLIIFSQECVAFTRYFTLYTDKNPSASFSSEPTMDECYAVMQELCKMYEQAV